MTIPTPPPLVASYYGTAPVTTTGARPVGAAVAVGTFVVVGVVAHGTALANIGVSDTKGNTWTKLESIVQTNAPGSQVDLWATKIATGKALTTSDTITVTRATSATMLFTAHAYANVSGTVAGLLRNTGLNVNALPSAGFLSVKGGDVLHTVVGFATAGGAYTPGATGTLLVSQNPGGTSPRGIGVEYILAPQANTLEQAGGALTASAPWGVIGVTLPKINTAPVANAGPDQTVVGLTTVTLNGTGSSDVDGPIVGYSWTQTSGPSVTLSNAAAASPTFTAPLGPAVLVFSLTVTDEDDASSTADTVTITVTQPTPGDPGVRLLIGDVVDQTVLVGDTPPAVTDPVIVLDGVQLGWVSSEQSSDLEPLQATVQLATLDPANLVPLAHGMQSVVQLLDEYGRVIAAVYGKVAELSATQEVRVREDATTVQVWTVATVAIVDHSATENVPVTLTPAVESWRNRVANINAALPASGIDFRLPPDGYTEVSGRARALTLEGVGSVETMRAMLAEMPLSRELIGGGEKFAGRILLAPISDPDTGEIKLLSLHGVHDPQMTGGRSWYELDPAHPHNVDGCRVELAGAFRKGGERAITDVVVKARGHGDNVDSTYVYTVPGGGLPAFTTRPRVRRQIDTQHATLPAQAILDGAGEPAIVDMALLGNGNGQWAREAFVYRPETWATIAGGFFPDWSSDKYSTAISYGTTDDYELAADCFTTAVRIDPVTSPARMGTEADGSYTGVLTSVQILVAGGELTVTFSLRREDLQPLP